MNAPAEIPPASVLSSEAISIGISPFSLPLPLLTYIPPFPGTNRESI